MDTQREREPFLQLRFNLAGSFRDSVNLFLYLRRYSSENPWKIRGKNQLELTYFDFDKLELPGKRDTRGVLLNTRRHPGKLQENLTHSASTNSLNSLILMKALS